MTVSANCQPSCFQDLPEFSSQPIQRIKHGRTDVTVLQGPAARGAACLRADFCLQNRQERASFIKRHALPARNDPACSILKLSGLRESDRENLKIHL